MTQTDSTDFGNGLFWKNFFKSYMVDHFLHKQVTLFNVLEKYSNLKETVMEGAGDFEDDQYKLSLRTEIRATLFQAIETLFELIFSLEERNGVIQNPYMWYHLSTSDWRNNYDKIKAIGNGQVEIFDQLITANPKTKLQVSLVQYLFYFGVADDLSLPAIQKSLSPIKSMLISLAKEFSDRDEHNALKHSLRTFPVLQSIEAYRHGAIDPLLKIDLNNSLALLKRDPDGSLVIRIKPLDTVRDYRLSLLCCKLISNIIRSRRAHFYKGEEVSLETFSEETVPWAIESNSKVGPIEVKITPEGKIEGQNPI